METELFKVNGPHPSFGSLYPWFWSQAACQNLAFLGCPHANVGTSEIRAVFCDPRSMRLIAKLYEGGRSEMKGKEREEMNRDGRGKGGGGQRRKRRRRKE